MPYNERDTRTFGLLCPLPGDLPDPGIKPVSLMSPALAGGFFTTSATWEAPFSHFSSVQLLNSVRLFVTPWTAARQASLSITNSRSSLRLTSIESVMPSNHVIFYISHLPMPSIFPSIRIFSDESVLCIRWPKYWSFNFSSSLSNEFSGLISFPAGSRHIAY